MSSTNPYVHEIHVSEIREFKKCRFSHKLKFVDQFYPKTVAKPLEFGTAFHAGHEIYYSPSAYASYPKDVRRDLALTRFVQVCKEQLDENPERNSALVQEDYSERIELGLGMLRYYYDELAPILDANLEPISTELNFSVPLTDGTGNEIYCKCDKCWSKVDQTDFDEDEYRTEKSRRNYWDGLPVHLEGKIDLLLRDTRTGKHWILDWKTAASIDGNHEWLELDDQISGYLIAALLLGKDVAGFLYHEQLKAFPQPPKRNKAKRLGRWYSVDKNQDTNYELYLAEIANGDPEGYEEGNYDDFLEYLEDFPKAFYHRETIRKSSSQLLGMYNDLIAVVMEMINPNRAMYASPGKFNCKYCDFRQVCVERAQESDYEYTLNSLFEKKAPYYER